MQTNPSFIIKAAAVSAHPYLDTIVALLPSLLTVGGGLWAVYKYLREKKEAETRERVARTEVAQKELETKQNANRAALLEARKPFAAKQQDIYFDLLQTTATLSNVDINDALWGQAHRHFWLLFWGPVPVVADESVGRAVDRFAETLDTPFADFGIPMRNASMDLARACRESLGISWKQNFEMATRTTQTKGVDTPRSAEE